VPAHWRSRDGKLRGLFWVTVCGLFVMVVVTILTTADPAALEGTPGTAVITRCQAQGCYGSFRSDDGSVTVANTLIQGEKNASPGQRFTAYRDSHNGGVAVAGEGLDAEAVVSGVFLVAALVEFWFLVIRPRRSRRTLLRNTTTN
jgi:hypothetical protein